MVEFGMDVQAPVLGDFVMTDSSESGSLPEPATELLNMPRPVDVSEAQLQSGYSSSESPDDDSQPHEDWTKCSLSSTAHFYVLHIFVILAA